MPGEPLPPADPEPSHAGLTRSIVVVLVLVIAVTAGLYALGATHPPKRSAITSDRLGPENGASVTAYLDDAAAGLDRVGAGPRWALISLRAPVGDDQAWTLMDGTAPSQVAFHVPITGVATPSTVAAVTGDRGSLSTARVNAIAEVSGDAALGADGTAGTRDQQVSSVTVERLRSGCACIVAMVVRGTGPRLREVAGSSLVRGVQVLPADAAGGRFAVVALLPEQTDRFLPVADTAPVPPR
ncbi:hypothetical protein [Williamsia maris]|uniref:Secreted protein n=1 Tax=Williamsia maris TaxID=72806 RepID=A0ABT1HFD3_9NOCA|nr:hypothetical protein [Williamsia maris]MCP2176939.1 hypothetical protein [Williamsia maris]